MNEVIQEVLVEQVGHEVREGRHLLEAERLAQSSESGDDEVESPAEEVPRMGSLLETATHPWGCARPG